MKNTDIISTAFNRLKEDWVEPVIIYVGLLVVLGILGAIPLIGQLALMIIVGPIAVGMAKYFLNFVQYKPTSFELIASGFKDWKRATPLYILSVLAIFLGFIFFIIPGIFIAFMLALSFYILAEDSEIGFMDAMRRSAQMMDGYKMKYLGLSLIFAGLSLLGLLAFGIGIFFVMPLIACAGALFYLDVKNNSAPPQLETLDIDYEDDDSDEEFLDLDNDPGPRDTMV